MQTEIDNHPKLKRLEELSNIFFNRPWDAKEISIPNRLFALRILIRDNLNGDKFGKLSTSWLQGFMHDRAVRWYNHELEQKKERKERFENTHHRILWFMNDSLNADYGEFTCEDCKRTFYHSPREIHKGMQRVKKCVCGYCSRKYK